MIGALVYLLCALASTLCAVLLYRTYLENRTRMLLWSGVSFFCLAVNNILLFIDLVLVPNIDLSVVRALPGTLGFVALIWGMVWESQ